MWSARKVPDGAFVSEITDEMSPLLKEICETHLQQLTSNAAAYGASQSNFEMNVQGCEYRDMPISRYRVYCLERLREHFEALDVDGQNAVRALLPHSEANILWQGAIGAESGYDQDRNLPYGHAINVYGDGTP